MNTRTTTVHTIPDERVIDALKAAVEDYGREYVDPASVTPDEHCKYLYPEPRENGKPRRCIVGEVLHRMNIFTDDDLADADPDGAYALASGMHEVEGEYVKFSEAALGALETAQSRQDEGREWWSAMEGAVDWIATNRVLPGDR